LMSEAQKEGGLNVVKAVFLFLFNPPRDQRLEAQLKGANLSGSVLATIPWPELSEGSLFVFVYPPRDQRLEAQLN
jgi:hypothetical protein